MACVSRRWLSRPHEARRHRKKQTLNPPQSRSALAMTMTVAPVSASTAIHSVATPAIAAI
jgi:hypothetical protein